MTKNKDLEAVKQAGLTLEYIKNQTPEICLEALCQDKNSIKYIGIQMLKSIMEPWKQKKVIKKLNLASNNRFDILDL